MRLLLCFFLCSLQYCCIRCQAVWLSHEIYECVPQLSNEKPFHGFMSSQLSPNGLTCKCKYKETFCLSIKFNMSRMIIQYFCSPISQAIKTTKAVLISWLINQSTELKSLWWNDVGYCFRCLVTLLSSSVLQLITFISYFFWSNYTCDINTYQKLSYFNSVKNFNNIAQP